jgi:hypothetical protein
MARKNHIRADDPLFNAHGSTVTISIGDGRSAIKAGRIDRLPSHNLEILWFIMPNRWYP